MNPSSEHFNQLLDNIEQFSEKQHKQMVRKKRIITIITATCLLGVVLTSHWKKDSSLHIPKNFIELQISAHNMIYLSHHLPVKATLWWKDQKRLGEILLLSSLPISEMNATPRWRIAIAPKYLAKLLPYFDSKELKILPLNTPLPRNNYEINI